MPPSHSESAHDRAVRLVAEALALPLYEITRRQRPRVSGETLGSFTQEGEALRRELAEIAVEAVQKEGWHVA